MHVATGCVGPDGADCRQVLRCALLKQQRQLSYESWRFHLEIRRCFDRCHCRAAGRRRNRCCTRRSTRSGPRPGESGQSRVGRLEQQRKLTPVRIGGTVNAALMHEPGDNAALLWDAVAHRGLHAPRRRDAQGDPVARSPANGRGERERSSTAVVKNWARYRERWPPPLPSTAARAAERLADTAEMAEHIDAVGSAITCR